MPDTITLPGVGKTSKQTAYLLGGGLVLIVGVAWYRSKGAAAAAAPATTTAADQSQTDPATGYAYGSPEDAAALAQQAGYVSAGGLGQGTTTPSGPPTPGAFTTNGQWSQAAEDYLVNTVGGHADVVGNALGKYITGQSVTPDQVTIIEQAIAFVGYPPANGPSGYPPSIRTSTAPPPPAAGATNIKNASFVTITSPTTWALVARSHNVFGGNGQALFQYNLLPGKHAANDYGHVQATGGGSIKKSPGFQVAIPVKGQRITLPGVGTVTS